MAKGRKKILNVIQRKIEIPPSRSQSKDRQSDSSVFRALEQQKQNMQKEPPIQEEKMSDAESVRSQKLIKMLRVDSLSGILIQSQSVVEKELTEVLAVEEIFNKYNFLLQSIKEVESDLIPKEIFPKGLTSFVADHGCNNYLNLFINLNWLYLRKNQFGHKREIQRRKRRHAQENLRQFVVKQKPKQLVNDFEELNGKINGSQSCIDIIYEGSDMQVFYQSNLQPQYVLIRVSDKPKPRMYCYELPEGQDQVMWHIIVEKFKCCRIEEQFVGLARISMDDIMICPLCQVSFAGKIYSNTPVHRLWPK